MRVRITMVVVLCTSLAIGVGAQSAERIETVYEQEELRAGSAAYLAAASAGLVSPDADESEALRTLAERGLKELDEAEVTSLGEFSHMLMLAHEISGGVWYFLFPGPRYATRELAYREIVQGERYPGQQLSGERALRIVGRLLSIFGEEA